MNRRSGAFQGWKSLTGAAMGLFVIGVALYSLGVFLPILCKEFGWTRGQVSVGMSAQGLLAALLSPAVGFFVAKFGPKKSIVFGNILILSAFLGLSFQQQLWHFYVAYAAIGTGIVFCSMIAGGALSANWFSGKAPLAISILASSAGVGGFLLVPLITPVIGEIGWRGAYRCISAFILVIGVLAPLAFVKNRPEDIGLTREDIDPAAKKSNSPNISTAASAAAVDFTLKEALRTREFWTLTVLGITSVFVVGFFSAHMVAYLTGIGLSSRVAGLSLGVMSGATVVSTLLAGVLALKFSLKKLTILAAVFILLSPIIALVAQSTPLAIAVAVLFGAGYGGLAVCIMSLLSAYFGRTNFSKILGFTSLLKLIGVSGAPVGGFLFDAQGTYLPALIIMAGAATLGVVCMLISRSPADFSLKARGGQAAVSATTP